MEYDGSKYELLLKLCTRPLVWYSKENKAKDKWQIKRKLFKKLHQCIKVEKIQKIQEVWAKQNSIQFVLDN